jgi:precorrin-2 dehydrogenase/sirohydrochlorin ferrochelatase
VINLASNYPIILQLTGKKVVVVGGGKVAERKVAGLLRTGAVIKVISPKVTDELSRLALGGQIQWLEKPFSKEDLDNAFMVFAATNDRNINQFIKESTDDHQLITISDNPEESDFHVPAQVQRGRLCIAISTGGSSPTLAKNISEKLEYEFDEPYEDYLEFLYWARKKILNEVTDPSFKKQLLTTIVSKEFLNSNNREADFLKIYNE